MRVLMLGISSMLGRYMLQSKPDDVYLWGTYLDNVAPRSEKERSDVEILRMDIKDSYGVRRVFKIAQPDVVIHSAGIGSVDYCQTYKALADLTNVRGTKYVCEMCRRFTANLIYLSTNAVFDGMMPPYSEERWRRPQNHYGQTKLLSEDEVTKRLPESKRLIVRPMLLYGWPWPNGRGSWATKTIEALQRDEMLHVVDDRFYQPTYAADLAAILWQMIEDRACGTFHIAGPDRMSLYEFVQKVCLEWGRSNGSLVEFISSDQLKGIAPRPADTTYDLGKAKEMGYITRPVEVGLRVMRLEDK